MPKTVKVVIADALADLTPEEMERFRLHLLERRGPPRLRRSQVDKKTYLELSDLLVNTFTQQKSIEVILELLRDIGCNSVAEDLEQEIKDLPVPAPTTSNSAGASGGKAAPEEHFIDRHHKALVDRVSNINPILDVLLREKVLKQEQYEDIMIIATTQNKMRALYRGPLKASRRCKDIFLSALEEEERFLIEDLREEEAQS